jgi:hypothetical protein
VRVDALRSHRQVRVELDGVLLAATDCPVMVFETRLPIRYYVDRADFRFGHPIRTDTGTGRPCLPVEPDGPGRFFGQGILLGRPNAEPRTSMGE